MMFEALLVCHSDHITAVTHTDHYDCVQAADSLLHLHKPQCMRMLRLKSQTSTTTLYCKRNMLKLAYGRTA